jgi:hypothetical protein
VSSGRTRSRATSFECKLLPVVRSEGVRSRAAFVAAIALHLAAIALVRRLPLELPAPATFAPPDPLLVWLEPGDIPEARASRARSSSSPEDIPGARVAALRNPRAPSAPAEPTTIEPAEPGNTGESLPEAAGTPSAGTAPDGPGLTLEQLGIGDHNPFLGDAARRIGEKRAPGEGLRRSMADAIARSEQAHGLGPEGPVLKELVELTRRSDAALNATAVLRVATNASGHVLSVQVTESTSDARPWRGVAERLLRALQGKKLRVPRGGRGVTMDLRVVSHVELPSGADPGLGFDVLGIPLKKPGGDKSPRISILRIDPKGYKVPLPNGKVLELPSLPLNTVLEIAGDPVDLTNKAQRMVRAHLEKLWTNNVAEDAPPAAGSASAPPPLGSAAPPAAQSN